MDEKQNQLEGDGAAAEAEADMMLDQKHLKEIGLKRKIEFSPAWDKRSNDPSKDYGIHCVEIRFLVIGEKGAIQFLLYTGWMLPGMTENIKPMAADLGYHSFKPMYKGQEVMQQDCPVLNGSPCYYDGSGLQADKPWKILREHGGERLWEFLEKEYHQTFHD